MLTMQCLVCGSNSKKKSVLRKVDARFEEELELAKCSRCGHVSLTQIPTGFDSGRYEYYRKFRGLSERQVFNRLTKSRHLSDLDRFRKITPVARVLDVGCGKGDFLWALIGEDIECLGIDLAVNAIEVGKSFGLNVRQLDFFSSELDNESFDLITMYELIEHVPNPVQFVERAQGLLRPGGLLYLTTPNFNSLDRFFMSEEWAVVHGEHLSYFTTSSMRSMIDMVNGIDCLGLRTDNISLETLKGLGKTIGGRRRDKNKEEKVRGCSSIPAGFSEDNAREKIEGSLMLKALKNLANSVLRASRLGNSMKILCQKS